LAIIATAALANFQSDGVNMAVRQGRPPFGPGLKGDLLLEQEVVAVCSPALLKELPQRLSPADLEWFTLLSDAHDLWPEFRENVLGERDETRAAQMRFDQSSLAIDAAVAGQGIAVASRFLVEHDLKAGRLVQPSLAFEPL
jgi:LysR family glycine cleavage system transcriptional activator